MRQTSGILQVVGEMVSIVILALTGRFIGFAQATLESGTALTVGRALGYVGDVLSMYTRPAGVAVVVAVLVVASLVRIAIAYANRSVLLVLKEQSGIAKEKLSWIQRALRLPVAVLYRGLSGVATLIGAIALAICFRLFDPERPFGFESIVAYAQSLASGVTYATVGALFVLFALYGVALAVIGYVASPAILTLEEMAGGCRPSARRRSNSSPHRGD
jgi:hypothetical protein